jgi:hypothetical protein
MVVAEQIGGGTWNAASALGQFVHGATGSLPANYVDPSGGAHLNQLVSQGYWYLANYPRNATPQGPSPIINFTWEGLGGITDPTRIRVVRATSATGQYSGVFTHYPPAGTPNAPVGRRSTMLMYNDYTSHAYWTFAATGPLSVSAKVLLAGPWDATSLLMDPALNVGGKLPLAQPYSGIPWNYPGTEQVASQSFFQSNPNIVDWVLVELRTGTASTTTVAHRAGFLLRDGCIVDTDGLSALRFPTVYPPQSCHLVVRHRNHLAVMSASAVGLGGGTNNYDFTTAAEKAYGIDMKLLATGKYGMYSGDANADRFINASDITFHWRPQNGSSGYLSGDFNMDGFVNASDVTFHWRPHNGRATQVPN